MIVAGSVAWSSFNRSAKPSLPLSITQQASFIGYVPSSDWIVDSPAATYQNGVLTFTAYRNGNTLTITEQATPPIFNDVPQYFSTLTDRLNRYSTIGTAIGQVHLTKPKELNGDQQAVLNSNGTLLFVHPKIGMSDDDWRRFFNSAQTIKPN